MTNPQMGVSAQLSVRGGRAAIAFYRAAFGAAELYRVGGTDEDESVVSPTRRRAGSSFWVASMTESRRTSNFVAREIPRWWDRSECACCLGDPATRTRGDRSTAVEAGAQALVYHAAALDLTHGLGRASESDRGPVRAPGWRDRHRYVVFRDPAERRSQRRAEDHESGHRCARRHRGCRCTPGRPLQVLEVLGDAVPGAPGGRAVRAADGDRSDAPADRPASAAGNLRYSLKATPAAERHHGAGPGPDPARFTTCRTGEWWRETRRRRRPGRAPSARTDPLPRSDQELAPQHRDQPAPPTRARLQQRATPQRRHRRPARAHPPWRAPPALRRLAVGRPRRGSGPPSRRGGVSPVLPERPGTSRFGGPTTASVPDALEHARRTRQRRSGHRRPQRGPPQQHRAPGDRAGREQEQQRRRSR